MGKLSKFGLTGNQLKLIALVLMTVDHIGYLLFPGQRLFRIIGRLAMPIFAYMVAEGCRYTKNKAAYLGRLIAVAAVCQVVYFFAQDSLYQCIFFTFSVSVGLIFLVQYTQKRRGAAWLLLLPGLGIAWFLCEGLSAWIPGYAVDYGFCGALLPVIIYLGRDRLSRWLNLVAGSVLVCLAFGGLQWYSLAAAIPLALYNGQRGKTRIKYLFYLYYPAHLLVLHFLAYLI